MTLDENFGKDLLRQIKAENIQPRPKWQFLLKNYLIWIFGGISLLLGAISMSLVFYMINFNDSRAFEILGSGCLQKILLIVPFFWVICLIVFVLIIVYNIKHTKTGYRYPLHILLSIIILLSFILGGIFYGLGVDKVINNFLGRRAPFYDRIMNPGIGYWSQSENGRLTGVFNSKIDENSYSVIDCNNKHWTVIVTEAKLDDGVKLSIGSTARFLGKIKSPQVFEATKIISAMRSGDGFYNRFKQMLPKGRGHGDGRGKLLPVDIVR